MPFVLDGHGYDILRILATAPQSHLFTEGQYAVYYRDCQGVTPWKQIEKWEIRDVKENQNFVVNHNLPRNESNGRSYDVAVAVILDGQEMGFVAKPTKQCADERRVTARSECNPLYHVVIRINC